MQSFFRFVENGSRVLIVGLTPLMFAGADGAAIQQRLGSFERLFCHTQRSPRFAIDQLGFPKDKAIEQKKPLAYLHAIANVGEDRNDTARTSRAEVRESILVGHDLPRLGFEDRPDRT
jgi:hypothetical protein